MTGSVFGTPVRTPGNVYTGGGLLYSGTRGMDWKMIGRSGLTRWEIYGVKPEVDRSTWVDFVSHREPIYFNALSGMLQEGDWRSKANHGRPYVMYKQRVQGY